MMSATGREASVGGLLFPGTDAALDLQRALEERSALKRVVDNVGIVQKVLVGAVSDEIATVVAGLLEMDVVDVLVSGWRKHAALVDAANRTVRAPGEREIVDLATHRITSTHRPRIDLFVDDVLVGSIDLQIDVEVVLHGVSGVVSQGRLAALRSGRAEVEAELSCEGIPIRSARKELDLGLEIELGSGIQLVEPLGYVTLPDATS